MLTAYRRHIKRCPHRSEGRKYRRCRCPIWADGFFGRDEIRKSLDTQDWEKAQGIIRKWEAEGEQTKDPEPVTIAQATQDFLRDAEARGLRPPTLYKYRLLFRQMESFAQGEGFRFLREFDLGALRKFRAGWPNHNLSALKKLECLRAFFRFAHESKWIDDNPARHVARPQISDRPTMPFTREEVIRILAACDRYGDNYGRTGQANARRLRALVLMLRYSGMRIGDTVTLERERITGNKLLLYTAKTGTPVYCPLPDFLIQALDAAPQTSRRYFFWSGDSKVKSAVGDWQRSLSKLFRLAEVSSGHAHRFRDTFAVELLLADVPLERVSMLLGHQSVKITEKHYAPWVHARQAQLEADVRRVWSEDPVALLQKQGSGAKTAQRSAIPN
ncbi:MAG TPA: site-specific integrase [Terriglobia bacterium]|nr:site-specific integrase [Terriglobia bacterium]